jgi:ABC-2 type transport system ATP-binding protein
MQLQKKSVALIVEFYGFDNEVELQSIEGVEEVRKTGKSTFQVMAKEGMDVRPEIFRFAADRKLSLVGLKQEENSLENIFRELTSNQEA